MRLPVLASLLVDIMRTPAGLAGTRPWWCAAVGVAMILTVAGCSSDSDGTAPLPVGFVEGTVELQGEGLLGDQRVRLERDWEVVLIDVDGNGSYRSEIRAGEVWSASFLDSYSYVGASEPVAFLVEEGETATLTPLEAKRAVYE